MAAALLLPAEVVVVPEVGEVALAVALVVVLWWWLSSMCSCHTCCMSQSFRLSCIGGAMLLVVGAGVVSAVAPLLTGSSSR